MTKLVVAERTSTLAFVPKIDDRLQFCVNHRRLNAVREEDSCHIFQMNEFDDLLGKRKSFITFDTNFGFWQIKMDDKETNKTAFVTNHSILKHINIFFQTENAPAMFQLAMVVILASVKWRPAIVCIDDIIILSKTSKEYRKHINKV